MSNKIPDEEYRKQVGELCEKIDVITNGYDAHTVLNALSVAAGNSFVNMALESDDGSPINDIVALKKEKALAIDAFLKTMYLIILSNDYKLGYIKAFQAQGAEESVQ